MQPAIHQKQVHIQTQVQGYERKNDVGTRVIDETTLRVYFPGVPNTDLMFSTSMPTRSTLSSSCDQNEATSTQGRFLLSLAFSPPLPTMIHDSIWQHYV